MILTVSQGLKSSQQGIFNNIVTTSNYWLPQILPVATTKHPLPQQHKYYHNKAPIFTAKHIVTTKHLILSQQSAYYLNKTFVAITINRLLPQKEPVSTIRRPFHNGQSHNKALIATTKTSIATTKHPLLQQDAEMPIDTTKCSFSTTKCSLRRLNTLRHNKTSIAKIIDHFHRRTSFYPARRPKHSAHCRTMNSIGITNRPSLQPWNSYLRMVLNVPSNPQKNN